jgi:hypothetical protein
MHGLPLNTILNRENKARQLKEFLETFEKNKMVPTIKRGIYLYGEPGTGKTCFVFKCLKEMDYDTIFYDASDIRNKLVLVDMNKQNMADKNVFSLMQKHTRKIAIIMDEIDGMNNGDKGGINALIKLIRPKKTKKQKNEEISLNPIICIGSNRSDKKLRELMKACLLIELPTPRMPEILHVTQSLFTQLSSEKCRRLAEFCQRDLRKLQRLFEIYTNNPSFFVGSPLIETILEKKTYNDDAKQIVNTLLKKEFALNDHALLMNDTDRTSVGLLWHENIIDCLEGLETGSAVSFYIRQLENICFADYIDRATFQNQIWQFNEMSSLIKTMSNHSMYHREIRSEGGRKPSDIRFTKVLTKYTTEYNNSSFLQDLCQQLGMDKKDLFGFFMQCNNPALYHDMFENYEISKLDINRIHRYLEKYTCNNALNIA